MGKKRRRIRVFGCEEVFKNKARENQLAQFDCGAAWMAMTMQARLLGFFTHGMGGINRNMVRDLLLLNEQEHTVIMGFAVGEGGFRVTTGKFTGQGKTIKSG